MTFDYSNKYWFYASNKFCRMCSSDLFIIQIFSHQKTINENIVFASETRSGEEFSKFLKIISHENHIAWE